MREIPMPPDRRPIAQQAALDAARNDDGLRVRLVQAIWCDEDLPTAAAQTGGFVYEIADRVARAVEERERDLRDEQERTAGRLADLWAEHDDLTAENRQQREEIERARAQVAALQREVAFWEAGEYQAELVAARAERDALKAELDEARAAIKRVKEIHRRSIFPATSGEWRGKHYCPACTYSDDGWTAYAVWPCATAAALDAPQRPEDIREETGS